MTTLVDAGRAQLRRDFRLLWRRRGDAVQPLLFALMVVALFQLALGADSPLLSRIAPACCGSPCCFRACSTSMHVPRRPRGRLAGTDDAQPGAAGLAGGAARAGALVRVGAAIAAAGAGAGEFLHLPRALLPPLLLSLALGTPLLSLLGAVVAALTVGIRRSGMLLAVLALPFSCRYWCSAPGPSRPPPKAFPGSARSTSWPPAWPFPWCWRPWPPPPPCASPELSP
jgi:heme exporter protein B